MEHTDKIEKDLRQSISQIEDVKERMALYRELLMLSRSAGSSTRIDIGGIEEEEEDFTPTAWSSFKKKPRIPKVPLIHGLLRTRESALIHAPSGVAKSWISLYLAMLCSNGGGEGIWKVDGEGFPTLYIDGELDPMDLIERVELIEKTERPNSDNFILYNIHDQCNYDFDILSPYDQGRVEKFVIENGIKMVVIDNMRCLSTMEDENTSNGGTDILGKWVDRMQGQGCSVVIVHHSTKSADPDGYSTYSGTNSWERAMSIRMALKQVAPYDEFTGTYEVAYRNYKRRHPKGVRYEGHITIDDNKGVILREHEEL